MNRRPVVTPATSKSCRGPIIALSAVLQLGVLSACGQPSADNHEPTTATLVPRSVANLNGTGDLFLDFSVNDVSIYQGFWTSDFSSALQVDANLMTSATNEIVIAFSFQATATAEPIALATARHLLPAASAGSTVTFPAIVYRYEDTDADGRYNVHELAASNADVDNDGLINVLDVDSDNDGINDGLDATPYGGLSNPTNNGNQRLVDVQLPDGTLRTLSIDQIVGDPEEVNHLVETLGSARLQLPDNWPTAIDQVTQLQNATDTSNDPNAIPVSTGWTAFSLGGRDRTACPDWRLLLDTTSISSSTTQAILLYFRLADREAQLAPLGATSISDLDVYNHTPPFDGNGPLNNALRLMLVPPSTLGWVELWTERSLMGTACTINLATD